MLAEILACPVCHTALEDAVCTGCGRRYAVNQGALNLTPIPPPDPHVQARWDLWEQLQANGERAYEAEPAGHLSVGKRRDAQAFADFSDLQGLVLDVGCGIQALPSYGHGLDGRLVGVDPLRGKRDREFEFVQAIAEYLPFRDRTFDRVLFATSIDHVLVPELAVAEARRVTKLDGSVCVWFGEIGALSTLAQLRARIRRPRWMRMHAPRAELTLGVPDGAIDEFHVTHPDAETVTGWLEQAGLTVKAVERPLPGHCFVRAVRD